MLACITQVLFSINKLLSFHVRAEVFWDFASSPMINPSVPSSSNPLGYSVGHFSRLRSQTRYSVVQITFNPGSAQMLESKIPQKAVATICR
jgi:hypothetical protein